jgi:hypothetical protein
MHSATGKGLRGPGEACEATGRYRGSCLPRCVWCPQKALQRCPSACQDLGIHGRQYRSGLRVPGGCDTCRKDLRISRRSSNVAAARRTRSNGEETKRCWKRGLRTSGLQPRSGPKNPRQSDPPAVAVIPVRPPGPMRPGGGPMTFPPLLRAIKSRAEAPKITSNEAASCEMPSRHSRGSADRMDVIDPHRADHVANTCDDRQAATCAAIRAREAKPSGRSRRTMAAGASGPGMAA